MAMRSVSCTELRENLEKHLDAVCESRAPLVVTRQNGEPVVVISLAEYEALEETLHLVRDPNAQPLLRSIREAEAGQLVEHDIGEWSSSGAHPLGLIIYIGRKLIRISRVGSTFSCETSGETRSRASASPSRFAVI